MPVYGRAQEANGVQTMYKRWITGNFVDTKLAFNQRQQVAVAAAFMGVAMPNGEAVDHRATERQVDEKIAGGALPSRSALYTALSDFRKIKAYLATQYISDLQGVLELNTGRFYIMDPLAVVPKDTVVGAEVLQMNQTSEVVDGAIGQINAIIAWADGETRKKNAPRGPVPRLAPPPS